ncbi:MAG: acyl-CoA dehydrogenase family protein [Deltaproteobacteria bacterium]|nr:acyl-CoA dehydrogenase family protein [Deltaproteobacteria bacterium]
MFEKEEHKLLRQTIRAFAEKELAPIAAEIDEKDEFPEKLFKKLGPLGILGITASEKYSGAEAGFLAATIAMEELGRISASFALSYLAHTILCVNGISENGSASQKQKYLPKLISGSHIGGMAMTEPQAGSDAVGMKCKAVKKGDKYILNGEKTFITNGAVGDVFVVYARTSEDRTRGLSAFIVEKQFKGFSIGKKLKKMGMRGSPTTELIFKDCEVPEENLIKEEGGGLKQMMDTLDVERITISGISLGIAEASLEKSLEYSKERKQFDKTISEFQMVQKMIADMATQLEAARCFSYYAASLADEKEKDFSFEATACKVFAAEMATRAAMDAIQIFGGYGYTKEYPVERYARDAKLMEIGAGTSQIMRVKIFRELQKR